jgi:hypothetical protein
MVVMLFTQHLLKDKQTKLTQWVLRTGVLLCSIGSLIYMILNPRAFGPGYWVVGAGFIFVVMGMATFLLKAIITLKKDLISKTIIWIL